MIIDITEEERQFLERMCYRAEMLTMIGVLQTSFEKDRESICNLKKKFREMKRIIQEDLKNDN